MSKKKAFCKTNGLSGVFDIIVVSTSAAYTFTTVGASGVTWEATWDGGSTSAVGDNPIFDLSSSGGLDVNITATNCILSGFSWNIDYTSLRHVTTIDVSLKTSINALFRKQLNCPIIENVITTSAITAYKLLDLAKVNSIYLSDTSLITDLSFAYYDCPITEVQATDYSSVTTVTRAWFKCRPSFFPVLDLSNCESFSYAWFDSRLDDISYENVLHTLDNSGKINKVTVIGRDLAYPITPQAQIYLDSLTAKGWSFNG